MFHRLLSRFITTIFVIVRQAVEGKAPPRELPDPMHIDCPDHGRTFLTQSRRTACCYSLQWLPSGIVKTRREEQLIVWPTILRRRRRAMRHRIDALREHRRAKRSRRRKR